MTGQTFAFGQFQLDIGSRRLRCNGEAVAVELNVIGDHAPTISSARELTHGRIQAQIQLAVSRPDGVLDI